MREQIYNELKDKLNAISEEIKALPESTGNGQLIDAVSHLQSSKEHLRKFFMQIQGAE